MVAAIPCLVGRALPLAALVLLVGCSPFDLFEPGHVSREVETPDTVFGEELLDIDDVDVLILESFPVQVNAVVRGTVPDACTEIAEIVQERTGNEITIRITTSRDPDLFCAEVLTPVEETIALEGEFPPGEYTLTVTGASSGVTLTFHVD